MLDIEYIAEKIIANDYADFTAMDLEWFKTEVINVMAKGKFIDVNVLIAYNKLVGEKNAD